VRIAFLILLIANALIFFWGLGQRGELEGREPARMTQQQVPEKVRIVPPEAPPPAVTPAAAPTAAE
jgi:hypothetical protein